MFQNSMNIICAFDRLHVDSTNLYSPKLTSQAQYSRLVSNHKSVFQTFVVMTASEF